MTTPRTRTRRIGLTLLAAVTVPLLLGQSCPLTTTTTDTTTTATPLVVQAGSDMTVQTGIAISLAGSVSGGSGIYNYAWSPTTGLDNPSALRPVLTASAAGSTTYTLTVTDSLGQKASDSVVIAVTAQSSSDQTGDTGNGNSSGAVLAANAGPDQSTSIGAPVTLRGSASGGVPPYSFAWSPMTGLSNALIDEPVFTPGLAGTTAYTLTVTDSLGATATDTLAVTVTPSATIAGLMWGADYEGSGYQVLATFNSPMNKVSAETVSNYRITGTSIKPISAILGGDKRTVSLVFSTKLSLIAHLDIAVSGTLRDAAGGLVQPSNNFAIGPNPADTTGPTVVAQTWGAQQTNYTVTVEFSEAMDRASVEAISNYALAGVRPSTAVLDVDGKSATLTFGTTLVGLGAGDQLQISQTVRDINGRPTTSTAAAPIDINYADVTGPTCPASARIWGVNQGLYTVQATFDEVLDKATAEATANYSLGGFEPTKAELDATGRTVVLTFGNATGGLSRTDTLTIREGVTDINGQPNTSTDPTTIAANPLDIAGPALSSDGSRMWKVDTDYMILLTFSEAVDKASATTAENYTLAGDGGADIRHPDEVVLDSTGRLVTLTFSTSVAGLRRTDLLSVKGGRDKYGNALGVLDVNGNPNSSTEAAGIESNPVQTIGPVALSRTRKGDGTVYQVEIVFDQPMDKTTTTHLPNYVMHTGPYDILTPATSAVLSSSGKTVLLTFGATLGGLGFDDPLEILPAVSNINGRGTTSITTAGAQVEKDASDTTPPTVVSAVEVDGTTVDVLFSEVLDKTSAEAASYALPSDSGFTVGRAELQRDGRTVRLFLDLPDPPPDPVPTPGGLELTVPDTVMDINGNTCTTCPQQGILIVVPLKVETVPPGGFFFTLLGIPVPLPVQATGGTSPYEYSWTPTTDLTGADTDTPIFTPTKSGVFNFKVTVTDSKGQQASSAVRVYVF